MYNCKKTNDTTIPDKYFTDLHDTLITPMFCTWGSDFKSYNLDIDKDIKNDISITTDCYLYHFSGGQYIKIVCYNGFRLAYTTYTDTTKNWTSVLPGAIDPYETTIRLPKEFEVGDTVKLNQNFTDSLMISYLTSSGGAQGNIIWQYYSVSLDKYIYLAFSKENGNTNFLAWLKIKVTNPSSIILSSCRYINHDSKLIIE
jgi:hypothetical protein